MMDSVTIRQLRTKGGDVIDRVEALDVANTILGPSGAGFKPAAAPMT